MGLSLLLIWVLCAIYVQNRGKVQHKKIARRFSDHSNILAPVNCLYYVFSSIKNTPYIDVKQFEELKVLEENWEIFKEEALKLDQSEQIKSSDKLDDLGFNSFFRTGWKRFYLKWYGSTLSSASHLCPKTVEILESIPCIKAAMFTMLPPGATLQKHRDPYAGSLRYHLGLVTPNSEDCYIDVDGEKYFWKDGEAVMFDETYIHYATNNTSSNRIILFLDIKRPVNFFLIDWINSAFSRVVLGASATKNLDGDKMGFLNRIFSKIYKARLFGKKIKTFSRPLYYFLQILIYLGLIYLIFF